MLKGMFENNPMMKMVLENPSLMKMVFSTTMFNLDPDTIKMAQQMKKNGTLPENMNAMGGFNGMEGLGGLGGFGGLGASNGLNGINKPPATNQMGPMGGFFNNMNSNPNQNQSAYGNGQFGQGFNPYGMGYFNPMLNPQFQTNSLVTQVVSDE
jgi:hypothetical protein